MSAHVLMYLSISNQTWRAKPNSDLPSLMYLHSLVTPMFLISVFLILLYPHSAFPLHRLLPSQALQLKSADESAPTNYFEVSRPINRPNVKPCSYHVLHHDFASTYPKTPVFADYAPPTHCSSREFSSIVLEWKATSKGQQYDRIFGVWLGGVELLRSCTAEPLPNGVVWRVEKDITKYYSLLMANQTLSVYMGNHLDTTHSGVYHVDITIHFYPSVTDHAVSTDFDRNSAHGNRNRADLILPISRNLPLNDGLWFEIQNSTDIKTKNFAIPPNAYRAVLEVYVSYHENDEFWYSNFPNEYLKSNNISNIPGNGPFREIVVSLDGSVMGAIWPFTVIYTGGVNPLLWRPISAIGSFDLPTYDIEVTPFLGKLLDEKSHTIGFSVTNALNVWYIDANLHLWLDTKTPKTKGMLLRNKAPPLELSSHSNCKGSNGKLATKARRLISSTGWVKSSHGKIFTSSYQLNSFSNTMVMAKKGASQIVNQTISSDTIISIKKPYSHAKRVHLNRRLPLYMYTDQLKGDNADEYSFVANITLGFGEDRFSGHSGSSLRNLQSAQGNMLVKGNLLQSGIGSTQQVYGFESKHGPCYYRRVSSSNYTILYDHVKHGCAGHGLISRFGAL